MPTLPSIKGSVFAGLVEDIQKLLDRGPLKQDELTRWLNPKDLAVPRGADPAASSGTTSAATPA